MSSSNNATLYVLAGNQQGGGWWWCVLAGVEVVQSLLIMSYGNDSVDQQSSTCTPPHTLPSRLGTFLKVRSGQNNCQCGQSEEPGWRKVHQLSLSLLQDKPSTKSLLQALPRRAAPTLTFYKKRFRASGQSLRYLVIRKYIKTCLTSL